MILLAHVAAAILGLLGAAAVACLIESRGESRRERKKIDALIWGSASYDDFLDSTGPVFLDGKQRPK